MVKGWVSSVISLFSVFAFVALLGLTSNVNAAGICSDSNGLPLYGGLDCEFRQDPGELLGCPPVIEYIAQRTPVSTRTAASALRIMISTYSYASIGLSQPFDGPL